MPPTLPLNSPFGPRDLLWLVECAPGVLVDSLPRLALMLVRADRESTFRGASPVGMPAIVLREKRPQPILRCGVLVLLIVLGVLIGGGARSM